MRTSVTVFNRNSFRGWPVGWISAASADVDLASHWLTHALFVATIAFALPTLCCMPRLIDPRAPFTPALAACTFPMDIFAIALIKYKTDYF